ncbi:SurA N-terminal domain-containing protein [Rhodobacter capsulatus]|jgi:peptidyl-prolyl cis-trans isomerase D|uniref:SurA N-terminal domain-containing protein n=1 Tax=Rhodobacter capsulatus TaxID=1061 RepID=UPI00042475B6|nr:SurA N-terminal domain-containing protein [Rhodobacter capsulatus]MDS0927896.1 SurA N-terminal domain-containing protein [Rhodobacter capsulatus]TQD38326.1 peptidylprolyl isomerase [Rhodobacter capsulatus]
MSTMLRSSGKSVTVWVLLAMIVLGLGGYQVGNFSNRGQSIGAVGESEITARDYADALRQEINAVAAQIGHPPSMSEVRAMGLDQVVQAQLFNTAALSEQARRLELSVGDAEVSRQIRSARPFQGATGSFDRETYREVLRREGLTETEFETRLRADIARSILQGAVAGGVPAPAALLDGYVGYLGETRDVAFAEIPATGISLPAPDAAALKAYYDAHLAEFTRPETREISYVWLTPDMLKDEIAIDEAQLRATYDERKAEYVQPERRKLAKLVFPTQAEAEAGMAKIAAGTASLADLAEARGLSAADIDLGDVSQDEIGGAAGEAVFARTTPGVIGPYETDLGPALFDFQAVTPSETTTFEEARGDIAAELAMEKARRMIADMTTDLEDRLASGATLEDMVKETKMQPGKISMAADTRDGIAAYDAFREAAAKVTTEDFPELAVLEDGGVFALRLDGVTAAAPIPFDQLRDKVEASWRTAEMVKAKQAKAEAAGAAGQTLAAQGLAEKTAPDLQRGGFVEGAPQGLAQTAFATAAGKSATLTEGDKVFVVTVRAVKPADPADPELVQLRKTFDTRLSQMLGADLAAFYARAAQAEAGITLDSAMIAAVQAQFQ